ncbi:hypothetical protein NEF87_002569 [Candidatus Lokiarchaeum ossiferum]|uniref:N-acetyltransferase domain-containing protein n=1 Tax=Candidatus Lokiarchaeum ossiferum TaxID=2951803 RepID=A0ABY6HS01_9ARCH|nr:hypothetical protein NEF87_002569 [Candidatus Lokiarchaeum sp. B-35]
MIHWSIDELHRIRQSHEEKHKNIHIIDIINGKIFDFDSIFETEQEANEKIQKDIENLIKETYDSFGGHIKFDQGTIFCAFYHKKKKDIVGTIALYQFSKRNVEYIEVGLSLISKKYRKKGFQSVEARRIREYAFFFLKQGNPFYISARMASAATQLQVHRGQLPDTTGKIVNVAYPKGFVPFYIANKNKKGNYLLEFGLFYDAWPTLGQIVEKTVYLPSIVQDLGFHIFNSEFHKDLNPKYQNVSIFSEKNIVIKEKTYDWNHLKQFTKIYGNLKTKKRINSSKNSKFTFSLYAAPDLNNMAVAIESVSSLDFLTDINVDSMKSVNITLQISDFSTQDSMIANNCIIQKLIEHKFVPTCVYDIKFKGQRIRVALFAKWQNIAMQEYFEFLHYYHTDFDIFRHDCEVQNMYWNPQIEIMTEEKIVGKILVDRFKTIL